MGKKNRATAPSATAPPKKQARTALSVHEEEEKSAVPLTDEMEADITEGNEIGRRKFSNAELTVPKDIPFQYEYEMDKFYVRPCYSRYYDYILEMLETPGMKGKRGVTVTGTPGIGKSMFMAYFFLRYTSEHKQSSETIILASYDSTSTLEEVAIWSDGAWHMAEDIRSVYTEFPGALVLLDGPPGLVPKRRKYLVFTSPNETWFKRVSQASSHQIMYMPLWGEDELTDAVDTLGLRDQFELLDLGEEFPRHVENPRYEKEELYRFDVFGGVARSCLGVDADFVDLEFRRLKSAIITAPREITTPMSNSEESRTMRHRVYHYVPHENMKRASLQVASEYARMSLVKRLRALSEAEKKVLRDDADYVPSYGVLYRILHEQNVHDQFICRAPSGENPCEGCR